MEMEQLSPQGPCWGNMGGREAPLPGTLIKGQRRSLETRLYGSSARETWTGGLLYWGP